MATAMPSSANAASATAAQPSTLGGLCRNLAFFAVCASLAWSLSDRIKTLIGSDRA